MFKRFAISLFLILLAVMLISGCTAFRGRPTGPPPVQTASSYPEESGSSYPTANPAIHRNVYSHAVDSAEGTTLLECIPCGRRHRIQWGDWQWDYDFYYEILYKGPRNFKVKPMGKYCDENGKCWAVHLKGCERNLPSIQACHDYLRGAGFIFRSDGEETNLGGGYSTVDRGEILAVPGWVYYKP